MTSATKDLIEEHSGIMLILKVMEKMADRLGRGEAIETDHLLKLVEFLQNFTDKCHHGKEEGILFPELAKNPMNASAINELLGEHAAGRDYIRGITESLAGYRPGNPEATHMAVNMRGYVNLLTQHIRKENEQLFQLADQQLAPETTESIQVKYDQLETEIIGMGKHEEYHRWLTELKTAYLVD